MAIQPGVESNMIDLTGFSDAELSLQVFNDEYFYTERGSVEYLIALLNEEFIYTVKQLEMLLDDLDGENMV